MRDWVYLTTAPNQMFAEMTRDMLIQNGVPAVLQPEDTASYYGVLAQPVRVMVAEGKLEVARSLLREWEAEESEESGDGEPDDPSDERAEDKGR